MTFRHTNRPGFWLGIVDFCTFGFLLLGPGIATNRFFDTLNRIERSMNGKNG